MNFFEAQDSARRSTSILVLLFVLAITFLLVLSNFLVFSGIYLADFSVVTFSPSRLEQVLDANLSVLICADLC